MTGKVLWLGYYSVIGIQAVTLYAPHICQAHLAGKIGIFTEILFHTAPARLSGQVQNRREDHIYTCGTRFCRDSTSCLTRYFWIPCRSQVYRGWIYRAGIEAVQTFFDE